MEEEDDLSPATAEAIELWLACAASKSYPQDPTMKDGLEPESKTDIVPAYPQPQDNHSGSH
jgi:hypothetical protein